jgi:hypothetical protein
MTEPVMPVLYAVKLPFEIVSVSDTTHKAKVRFHSGMKHTQSVMLLAVEWVVSSHNKLFLITHIYQRMSIVNIIILQAVVHAWRHHHIIGISAYFCYMRVAYTIDSQKSEDHSITDILS